MLKLLGRPSEEIWPGFSKLPNVKNLNLGNVQPYVACFLLILLSRSHFKYCLCHRYSNLRAKFRYTTDLGVDLMQKLLCYDPNRRLTAEEALKHPFFT